MRIIYLLLVSAALCSCSANWHLRQAKRHLNIAIEKGASTDSLYSVKYDTIKSVSIRDSIIQISKIDTMEVIANCDSIKANPSKAIAKIHRLFINEVAIDTVYTLTIESQGKYYEAPVRVIIMNSTEGFKYSIDFESFKVPFKAEQTIVEIKGKPPKWIWWLIAVMGICIVILIIKK